MSWKQLGNVSSTNNLLSVNFNSIITKSIIIIDNFKIQDIVVNGNLSAANVDVSLNLVTRGNMYGLKNLYISDDVSLNNLYVCKDAYLNNKLFFGTLVPDTGQHSFFYGNSISGKFGINTVNPTTVLDITGPVDVSNILTVRSNSASIRNILAQNNTNNGVTLSANSYTASVSFFPNGDIINNVSPVSTLSASGDVLTLSSTNAALSSTNITQIHSDNYTQLSSKVSISNRNTYGSIVNETVSIYDTSSTPLLEQYYQSVVNTGNALSLIGVDTSSTTFLNLITPNKKGLSIGGGSFVDPGSSRSMGLLGLTDVSGTFTPSQIIVSSNDTSKYRSTTGFNTFSPKTEEYVVDVNGPMRIGNGEINITNTVQFEIKNAVFNRLYPQFGIVLGSPSSTDSSYVQFISMTTDGGATWKTIPFEPGTSIEDVPLMLTAYICDPNNIFVCSQNLDFVYYTDDAGANWSLLTVLNNGNKTFNTIYAFQTGDTFTSIVGGTFTPIDTSINTIFVYNTIASTVSNFDTVDTSLNISAVDGSGSVVYFVGNGIQKYNFSNYTFLESKGLLYTVNTMYQYNDVYLLDELHVVAVGNNIISYTKNGTSWTNVMYIVGYNTSFVLNSVFVYDLSRAVAVGNNGLIVYTTNGYATWNVVPSAILNSSGIQHRINGANQKLKTVYMPNINSLLITDVSNAFVNGGLYLSKSSCIYGFFPALFGSATNKVLDVSGNMDITGNLFLSGTGEGKLSSSKTSISLFDENVQQLTIGSSSTMTDIMGSAFINGDLSLNSNVEIEGNAIVKSGLYVQDNAFIIGNAYFNVDADISGNLNISKNINSYGNFFNSGLMAVTGNSYVFSNLTVAMDTFLENQLFVNLDTLLKSRLFVGSDAFIHSRLLVNDDAFLGSRIIVNDDAFLNNNLFVANDLHTDRLIVSTDCIINSGVNTPFFLFDDGSLFASNQYNLDLSFLSIPTPLSTTNVGSFTSRTELGSNSWGSFAMSQNNKFQTICQGSALPTTGFIYASSNYGVTNSGSPVVNDVSRCWTSVCMSKTGQYQYAICTNVPDVFTVFKSANYGVTGSWTAISTPITVELTSSFNNNIVTSANGKYVFFTHNSGCVYFSNDYATTWTLAIQLDSDVNTIKIACSSTGRYISFVADNKIYKSTAFGVDGSWTLAYTLNSGIFNTISMSNTGEFQYVSLDTVYLLYVSSNFGASWSTSSAPLGIKHLSTENGQTVFAASATTAFVSNTFGLSGTFKPIFHFNDTGVDPNVISSLVIAGQYCHISLANASTCYSTLIPLLNQSFSRPRLNDPIISNAHFADDFYIDNRLFVSGDVSMNSKLVVGGNVLFGSDLSLNGNLFLTQNMQTAGNLDVSGSTRLYSNLTVDNITVGSKLIISKYAAINTVFCNRIIGLHDSSFNSNLYINGGAFVNQNAYFYSDLSVNGNVNVKNDINLGGDLFVSGNLTITGQYNIIETTNYYYGYNTLNSESIYLNNSFGSDLPNRTINDTYSAGVGVIIYDNSNSKTGGIVVSTDNSGYVFYTPQCNNRVKMNIANMASTGLLVLNPSQMGSGSDYDITVNPFSYFDINNRFYVSKALGIGLNGGVVSPSVVLDVSGNALLRNSLYVTTDISVNRVLTYDLLLGNTLSFSNNVNASLCSIQLLSNCNVAIPNSSNTYNYKNVGWQKPATLIDTYSTNANIQLYPDLILHSSSTIFIDAATATVLQPRGGSLGIGVVYPTNALDISGVLTVSNGDASFNDRLFVGSDASFQANLFVNGNTILRSLFANGDASLNRLFVYGASRFYSPVIVDSDLSLNGRLFAESNVVVNGNATLRNALVVVGDCSFQSNVVVGANLSVNGALLFNSDLSLNNRLLVSGDASFNNRLFVSGDVSLNSRLFVSGDISMNGFLYANFKNNSIPYSAINIFDTSDTQIVRDDKTFTDFINYSVLSANDGSIVTSTANSADPLMFAKDWVAYQNSTFPIISNAISNTGQYMCLGTSNGSLFTSSNFGKSWDPVITTAYNWTSVSISQNGKYQLAVASLASNRKFFNLYGSSAFGVSGSWNTVSFSTSSFTNVDSSFNTAISTTGKYQCFSIANSFFFSSAFGANGSWTSPITLTATISSCKISYDGKYVVVCSPSASKIYISNNYGAVGSWTGNTGFTNNSIIKSFAVSSTGQYMSFVLIITGAIYSSNDYGTTWSITGTQLRAIFTSISISSTGKYQCVCTESNNIYINTNYGVSGDWNRLLNVHVSNTITSLGEPYDNAFYDTGNPKTGLNTISISANGKYILYNPSIFFSDLDLSRNTVIISVFPEASASIGYDGIKSYGNINTYGNVDISNTLLVGGDVSFNGNLVVAKGIFAQSYSYSSDIRIKRNIVDVDGPGALGLLRSIQPRQFDFIDGSVSTLGFIAQEVREVLPASVSLRTNFIPNIYAFADVSGACILHHCTFKTPTFGGVLSDNGNSYHALEKCEGAIHLFEGCVCVGDCVKFMLDCGASVVRRVVCVVDAECFVVDAAFDEDVRRVFVYGKEVADLHSINQNDIYTLTCAAVKSLDQEVTHLKHLLAEQGATIRELVADMNVLMRR